MGEKMNKLEVLNADEIMQLNAAIHDCWFDIEKVSFKNDTLKFFFTRYLEIEKDVKKKFLFFKKYELLGVECILQIHEVKAYEIIDTEKVQYYDFNELFFDSVDNIISICTGVPITIKINVFSLKISLINTDNIIDKKSYWGI